MARKPLTTGEAAFMPALNPHNTALFCANLTEIFAIVRKRYTLLERPLHDPPYLSMAQFPEPSAEPAVLCGRPFSQFLEIRCDRLPPKRDGFTLQSG
jgi:hypothetical protein